MTILNFIALWLIIGFVTAFVAIVYYRSQHVAYWKQMIFGTLAGPLLTVWWIVYKYKDSK